jgi:hypothetical protein
MSRSVKLNYQKLLCIWQRCVQYLWLCAQCSVQYLWLWPRLDTQVDHKYFSKFYYAKRRFSITSKCRHMHGVLNVDEIKN